MKTFVWGIGLVAASLLCMSAVQASDCHYGGGYSGAGYSRGGISITLGSPYISRSYSGYRGAYPLYQGGGYGAGYNRIGSYNMFNNYGYQYGGYSNGVWHDTSHYDFHPGQYVPHGNHLDYIPAHYDYHRTGHWHH